uniref:Boudin n=1 Tax=Schmidtea mediterranea TaxID=79327 RepID=V9XQQ1_SCHMD|nr:boudin [Schmidtea mediterranea]
MQEKFIYILLIFIGLFELNHALTCFQCNSTKDSDCLENFQYYGTNSLIPISCPVDRSRFCIKTTGVFGSVVGVTRFCSSMDMGNQCQYLPFFDHDRTYRGCVYTCLGDNCNSANRIFHLNSFISITFIAAFWMISFCIN